MPQQREYIICIDAPFAAGRDAERNQTFLLVLYRLAAKGNTASCQNSVRPDSQTGSKHQIEAGLDCPATFTRMPLLPTVFIPRCGGSVAPPWGNHGDHFGFKTLSGSVLE